MEYKGKPCPVCMRTFRDEDDVVVCPKCGAPYHRECYQEKGKCIFIDLHNSGKSWKEQQEAQQAQKDEESADGNKKCPRCGAVNPEYAIVCGKCGTFLSDEIRQDMDGGANRVPPVGNGVPIFLDPMGGISPEEEFDGVTAAELSRFVGTNSVYYLPTFSRIKNQNRGRFHLSAFLLMGGWYLYRKQYLKGAIISAVCLLLEIAVLLLTIFYSKPLLNEASAAFENVKYVSEMEYFRWAFTNKAWWEAILMFLPIVLELSMISIRVICGFRANRSYYAFSVARIKKIKSTATEIRSEPAAEEEKAGAGTKEKETDKRIIAAGGVNVGIAWMYLACLLILSFASRFI